LKNFLKQILHKTAAALKDFGLKKRLGIFATVPFIIWNGHDGV
jgi:hypothetical protein